ncbi:MAG: hypothetical protein HGA16_02290 [Candidatus Moranbacteria bacterium]|jgi:hypothetical protein|nr:hypothetical protein [Candidatus Moranbacteria bacterium]
MRHLFLFLIVFGIATNGNVTATETGTYRFPISIDSASVGGGMSPQDSVWLKPLFDPERSFDSDANFTDRDAIKEIVAKQQVRITRIEILVESCLLRTIGYNASGEMTVREYHVATAMRGALSDALPYGVEGNVVKVVLNPSWTPTQGMIDRAIARGQSPPKKALPGAKNNPLGGFKLYFSFIDKKGRRYDDLGAHATTPAHEAEIGDGNNNRQSNGCVRSRRKEIIEVGSVLFFQNGLDAESIFREAAMRPGSTREFKLSDTPKVVYLRK